MTAPIVTIHLPNAKASLVAGILGLLPSYVTLEVSDGNLVAVDPGRQEAGRAAIDSLRGPGVADRHEVTANGHDPAAEPVGEVTGPVPAPADAGVALDDGARTTAQEPARPAIQVPVPKVENRPPESKSAVDADLTGRPLAEQRTAPKGSVVRCEQCDRPLTKTRHDQRFDSVDCSRKWYSANSRGRAPEAPVVLAEGPKIECGPCGLTFDYAARLDHHNRQFHQNGNRSEPEPESEECPVCGCDEFPQGWDLAKHISLMHRSKDRPKVGESKADYEARLRAVGQEAMAQ